MSAGGSFSFVVVAAVVEILALQFSRGVADAGDFIAKPVDAPAHPPFPTARWLTLQARISQNKMRNLLLLLYAKLQACNPKLAANLIR